MRVQYQITTDETYYNAAYGRYRKQHPFGKYADFIKWIGLVVLGACLVAVIVQRVWLPVATLSVFVAIIWFQPRIDRFLRRRQLRRSPFLNREVRLTFAEDFTESLSDMSRSTGSWKAFTEAVRFPDGWLLFMRPQYFRWLPDSALAPDSTLHDAESLIASRIADVRRQG